ncbi:hypothetical protein BU14_0401s0012 [Porphyra umbilicalis]|uniref:Uncharacterized protein n=1 Tax=Porphyra umbilicalis TaxID=2786 RepID=A0A1X6NW44_PORUM|nr:hypothetical protein BU14_0401s0012 [Porphyra umbilicalis]|eukprot:OSX72841.1 hypothetical protein BU14_0401s0012 [Porphyra umbilicalis]
MWAPWRGRGGVGGGLHAGPPGATFILVTAPPVAGRADRRPVRAGAPTAGSRDPAARGRARARPPPQRQPTAPLAPSGRPTGARKDDTATTVTQPPAMCRVGRRDDRAWRRRTETKEPACRAAAHTPTGCPAGGGARPPSSPAGGVRLRGARRRPSAAAVARPVPTAGRHGARRRPRGARGARAARRGGAAAAARGGGAADRRRRGSVWPRDARPRCGRVASPTPTGGRARRRARAPCERAVPGTRCGFVFLARAPRAPPPRRPTRCPTAPATGGCGHDGRGPPPRRPAGERPTETAGGWRYGRQAARATAPARRRVCWCFLRPVGPPLPVCLPAVGRVQWRPRVPVAAAAAPARRRGCARPSTH